MFAGRAFGHHHQLTAQLLNLEPVSNPGPPVGRVFRLADRKNTVGKEQVLTGLLIAAHRRNPDRQPEARNAAGGGSAMGRNDYGGGGDPLGGGDDAPCNQVGQTHVLISIGCRQFFPHWKDRPQGLNIRGNGCQHFRGIHRELAHGRFAGQHDGVGAVQDCIGHIGGFGAGGPAVGGHRLEHLRGGNDRLAEPVGFPYELFLNNRDLCDRNFHPQIAACHHDAVSRLQNIVDMFERAGALDFCDQERIMAETGRGFPNGGNVGGVFDEGLADRIDTVFEGKRKAMPVVVGEGADAQIDAGQIEAFTGTQLPPDQHLAADLPAGRFQHLELDDAVVQKKPVPRPHGLRQFRKGDRNPVDGPFDLFRGQGKDVADPQFDRLFGELAEPDLRAGKIGHDGHPSARGP